jgi:hypothetical protein
MDLVDGWSVDGDHPGNVDLQRGEQDAGISSIADTTVADTTVAASAGGKSPWPDDMVAWLNSRPEFTPGPPRQVMIGGRAATQVDVNVNAAGEQISMVCNAACWLVDGNFVMSFTEVRNSDGTGIVVITQVPADKFDDWSQSLDQLMATIEFR